MSSDVWETQTLWEVCAGQRWQGQRGLSSQQESCPWGRGRGAEATQGPDRWCQPGADLKGFAQEGHWEGQSDLKEGWTVTRGEERVSPR